MRKAIQFATLAHKDGKRKGTDIPYIVHPFEVALILTEAGCDEEVVVAGLLHDTIEDAGVKLEEISEEFGTEVADLVASCSEDKTLSWEDRKQHTINFLSQDASFEYLVLSCADKLSNLRSIKADYDTIGDKVWERFRRGKSEQKWYYRNLLEAFKPLDGYDMFNEMTELFAEIFE